MPFIHVYSYSGKNDEDTKRKAVQAIVKAASEVMGAPDFAFTVVFEEIAPESWETDVMQNICEPLRDKMLIDRGKLVWI
jgi:phenylpyruvate tautomerase PptA (4-oxalocrotonate tautomerase family)